MPRKENDTVVLIYFSVKALIKTFTLSAKGSGETHKMPLQSFTTFHFESLGG